MKLGNNPIFIAISALSLTGMLLYLKRRFNYLLGVYNPNLDPLRRNSDFTK